MTKGTKIVLGLILTFGVGAVIYYFATKGKDEKDLAKYEADENDKRKEEGLPPLPSPAQVDAPFDLVNGSKGKNVMALQNKLGVSADGWLGNGTQKAIEAKGFSLPLSKPMYDRILAGKSKVDAPLYKIGQPLWANKDLKMYKDGLLNTVYRTYNQGEWIGRIAKTEKKNGIFYAKISPSGSMQGGFVQLALTSTTDPKE